DLCAVADADDAGGRRPVVPPDGRNLRLRSGRSAAVVADDRPGPVPVAVSESETPSRQFHGPVSQTGLPAQPELLPGPSLGGTGNICAAARGHRANASLPGPRVHAAARRGAYLRPRDF